MKEAHGKNKQNKRLLDSSLKLSLLLRKHTNKYNEAETKYCTQKNSIAEGNLKLKIKIFILHYA